MKVRKHKNRRKGGFSLLELLAVVTILGIIAVVVIPRISVSAGTAKQNTANQTVAEINSAMERYYFDNGSFPSTLTDIFTATAPNGQAYFPDGVPKNPYTGTNTTSDWTFNTTTNRCSGYKTK